MRMRCSLRSLQAAVFAGPMLMAGGCSNALLNPPAVPTGTILATYHADNFSAAYRSNVKPGELLISGITYVDEQCVAFFDSVEQMNRQLKVGQSVFFTAGNQAQTLLRLANQSALAIAKVAAAVEITKVLLEQYSAEFAFAPHSVELRAIILQAMDAERKELEQVLASRKELLTHVEVVSAVKRYAQNCTLGNIREQWNRAIARAVQAGVKKDNKGSGGGAEGIDLPGADTSAPRSILSTSRYVVR